MLAVPPAKREVIFLLDGEVKKLEDEYAQGSVRICLTGSDVD